MKTSAYAPAVSRELRRAGFQKCALKGGLPVRSGFDVSLGGGGVVVVQQRMVLSGQVVAWQSALTHYREFLRLRGYLVEDVYHGSYPGLVMRLHVRKEKRDEG